MRARVSLSVRLKNTCVGLLFLGDSTAFLLCFLLGFLMTDNYS